MKISITKHLAGKILDIGGGGDGIIGRIYGDQVIAIDNRQEELDEAPSGFEKLLMDATALHFETACFDHATSFFTLMYMQLEEQREAIAEVARVLKPGGEFHVWDTAIRSAYPNPFCVDLEIDAAGDNIHTTYGIVKMDTQSAETITAMCEASGLACCCRADDNEHFYLRFIKS